MARYQTPRFRLLDAMALIVAVAVGIAILRSFGTFSGIRRDVQVETMMDPLHTTSFGVSFPEGKNRWMAGFELPIKGPILVWAGQISFWPGPSLAALTLVTLGLGLEQSRRLARRPGPAVILSVAAVMAMLAAAIRLPQLLMVNTSKASPLPVHWKEWWFELWFMVPRLAGLAVAVSWATMALGGRRDEVRGWLDRLGAFLGAAWIGMATLDLGASWYQALPW